MNTHLKGQKGEDIAAKYLTKHKYKILQRNFRTAHGEIDIVARDGDYIVFVEVKARQNDDFGAPREAVGIFKQQTIVKCAVAWLYQNKQYGAPTRFDVVEVLPSGVTLIKDAFRA